MDVPPDIRRRLDCRYLHKGKRYTNKSSAELDFDDVVRRRRFLRRNGRVTLREAGDCGAAPDADRLRRFRERRPGVEAAAEQYPAERQSREAEVARVEARDDDVHHGRSREFQADGAAGDWGEIRRLERTATGGAGAEARAAEDYESDSAGG